MLLYMCANIYIRVGSDLNECRVGSNENVRELVGCVDRKKGSDVVVLNEITVPCT